ncbi:MAG: N-acetylneuraminate synthase family protein [Eubacteriales bacterium]|nr:N-acetylneuraminate synthase family protein [Eubacteriales bacterium]
MKKIILDFGSGNTCQNDAKYIKRMYDELKAVDTGKYEVIVKWQLFERAGDNIPLLPENFEYAYEYGTRLGYKVTASVFDKNSLDFLLRFDIPFVKIANRRELDWLIGEVPRCVPIIVSIGGDEEYRNAKYRENVEFLFCVSSYPATIDQYYKISDQLIFQWGHPKISDHTTNYNLWQRYRPEIVEWHYKLSDSTGLDAGPFARTPEQLAEVL